MGGNRNAIAYGILKSAKVNTKGMSPKQAWQKVKELGLIGKAKSYGYTDDELDALFDEINNFHPTPEMERVIEKAKGVAKKVTVTTNAHENFEKAIDRLLALKERYGFEMLEEIRTEDWVGTNPASVRKKGQVLVLSNSFLENPQIVLDEDMKNFSETKDDYNFAKNQYDKAKKTHSVDNNLETEYINKAKKYAFLREHVHMYEGMLPKEIIDVVLTHEIGHIISSGFSNEKKSQLLNKFLKLKKQYELIDKPEDTVPIQMLSYRAIKDVSEFFSELFVAFEYKEPTADILIPQIIGENTYEQQGFLGWIRS